MPYLLYSYYAMASVGDVVWAKMKCYPWWPGKIEEPEKDAKRPFSKKHVHFVVFFGTDDYSWVADDFVKPYEPHIEKYSSKCDSASFKTALKCVEEYLSRSKSTKSESKPETSRANGVTPMPKKRHMDASKVGKATKTKKSKMATSSQRLPEASSTSSMSNKVVNADPFLPLSSNLSPNLGASSTFNDDNYDWTPEQPSGLLNHPNVESVKSDAIDMGDIVKPQADECTPPSDLKVGFLGLGIMGTGIAKHLVNAGLHVSVWNHSPTPTIKFRNAGVAVCRTVSEVVKVSDVVFSCVPDPAAAKKNVFGKFGVLETIGPGQGYVEISSIDHKTSSDIESAIQDKGAQYLEAPVMGSRELCLSAQLVILAAGESELFDKCKPLFETFAKHASYFGAVGNAAKMNILVNMLIGTSLASFAESMSLAERMNLSQANLLDIVKLGPLWCPLFIEEAKAMMEPDFNTSITLQHVLKDLQFALQLSHEFIQPLPITAAANEAFKHAKSLGHSDHDDEAV